MILESRGGGAKSAYTKNISMHLILTVNKIETFSGCCDLLKIKHTSNIAILQ